MNPYFSEDYLAHYGVKGMKWGKHKKGATNYALNQDKPTAYEMASKDKKQSAIQNGANTRLQTKIKAGNGKSYKVVGDPGYRREKYGYANSASTYYKRNKAEAAQRKVNRTVNKVRNNVAKAGSDAVKKGQQIINRNKKQKYWNQKVMKNVNLANDQPNNRLNKKTKTTKPSGRKKDPNAKDKNYVNSLKDTGKQKNDVASQPNLPKSYEEYRKYLSKSDREYYDTLATGKMRQAMVGKYELDSNGKLVKVHDNPNYDPKNASLYDKMYSTPYTVEDYENDDWWKKDPDWWKKVKTKKPK